VSQLFVNCAVESLGLRVLSRAPQCLVTNSARAAIGVMVRGFAASQKFTLIGKKI
jgi:hypothetical protein